MSTDGDERTLGERHDPVLVPEKIEESSIGAGLEVGDFEGVVGIRVDSEIFNLGEGDRLIL